MHRSYFLLNILLILIFARPSFANNYAIILGGDCGRTDYSLVRNIAEWSVVLHRLGWKTSIFYGFYKSEINTLKKELDVTEQGHLESIIINKSTSKAFLYGLDQFSKLIKAGDDVVFISLIHGIDTSIANTSICLDNGTPYPTNKLLTWLERIDQLNGNGKTVFLNSSCYSGSIMNFFQDKSSSLCAATSSANEIAIYPNYITGIGYNLSSPVRFGLFDENDHDFSLAHLFSQSLLSTISRQDRPFYTFGFGLEALNVYDYEKFQDIFNLLPDSVENPNWRNPTPTNNGFYLSKAPSEEQKKKIYLRNFMMADALQRSNAECSKFNLDRRQQQ